MSKLLAPLQIKNLKLKNRVVMSPMCQYSAINGYANSWHFTHYGTRAVGGCGAIIQEATAVSPEGRITYGDLGIWEDNHINNLRRVASFIENSNCIPGIQLAHAGRKASCDLPWNGGKQLSANINSWATVSASAIPFYPEDRIPLELNEIDVQKLIRLFKEAAERSIEAGYKIIEIHAAHGYLIHQFLSPLSNRRKDIFGGSFDNRIRFLLKIVDEIADITDDGHSLWVRISATDWTEGGWTIEDSVKLTHILKEKGVDVIDVSSGGNIADAKIPVSPGYQVAFSKRIKQETGIITGAVGLITEIEQAENIIKGKDSDLIFMGRELLRNPYFVTEAARKLNGIPLSPIQYERAYSHK